MTTPPPTQKLSPDEIASRNAISTFYYQLKKDTPGKFWQFDCKSPATDERAKKAIFKVMQLDPDDAMASIAISHIKLGKIDDAYHIVVPYPIPEPKDWPDGSNLSLWIDVEQVLAWNPKADTWHIMGDVNPDLFGAFTPDAGYGEPKIYGHPRRYLQEWARNRAIQLEHIRIRTAQKWQSIPKERDVCPGVLMVGDVSKIPWPLHDMPRKITCIETDAKKVGNSILKYADLPWTVQGT